MKILYYDCFSGISGDMNLGALLDLGVDQAYLLHQLALLALEREYEIAIENARKNGISGTKVVIRLLSEDNHQQKRQDINTKIHDKNHQNIHEIKHEHYLSQKRRTLQDIEQLIGRSALAQTVKDRSLKMFDLLAEAEAKVHGIKKEKIHFHEVGAVDAILDIVGAAICLEYLQVEKVIASTIELGGGFVHCEHGLLPVPAPAVTELLQGVPVKTGRVPYETTTPTGAVILAANVQEYTDQLNFLVSRVGYGVGQRDLEIPNVLRVYLGETDLKINGDCKGIANPAGKTDHQWMLETNIDDMNPEIYGYVEEKLFAEGALDVFKTPIIMKKGRPAVKLSVLAAEENIPKLKEIIYLETSAIGSRSYIVEKDMLARNAETIATKYGEVNVKFTYYQGQVLKYKAEYEDCKQLAKKTGIPLRDIYKEVDQVIGSRSS